MSISSILSTKNNLKISFHLYNSIKVFTSLYKFKIDLLNKINNNNNISGQKLILINKNWFTKYQQFYLFNEIFDLIKNNNISNFGPEEINIIFNNIYNRFISMHKDENMILFYNIKEEFPEIIRFKKFTSICYISEYEIINEEIYTNLKKHMGDFNLDSPNDNDKKFEYIITNKKMIFKYINNQELCFDLLFGFFDNNCLYHPEIFVNYKNKNDLEEEFKNLFDPNNIVLLQYYNKMNIENKNINDITQDFILLNENFNRIKLFINGYHDLNGTRYTNNPNIDEKSVIDSKKIVKFFIKLFLEYKDIKKKLNEDSYDLEYFLINKNWIDKFKEKYLFSNLIDLIINDKMFNNFDEKNLDIYINNISPNFFEKIKNINNKDLVYDLSNICLNSLNYDYCEKAKSNKDYIKIYKNFELWTKETYDLFTDIGFNLNNKPIKAKCYFQSKLIFILTKYNMNEYLNIYQIKTELKYDLLYEKKMVIKCNNINFILDYIKNKFFLKYIYSLNSDDLKELIINHDDNKGIAYLLSNEGNIYDKINKKQKRLDVIVNILINNEEIKRKSSKNIKENKKEKLYLVHKELFKAYLTTSGLLETYNNLKKKRLIEIYKENMTDKEKIKISEEKMTKEEKIKKLKKYIREKLNIDTENKFEVMSNISTSTEIIGKMNKNNVNENLDYITVKNNKEKIFYYNNYILLTKEILDLINKNYSKFFNDVDCLFGENQIFIFYNSNFKNIIEIGKLNEDTFQIEYIIDIYNNYEEEEKKLINEGFRKYYQSYFVFPSAGNNNNNNKYANTSPLFDNNFNIKGYGYKLSKNPFYKEKKEDFSDFNINNNLIRIIYVIIYFKYYKNFIEREDENFKYYLINENWINDFKKIYNYEETKKKIANNPVGNSIIKSLDRTDQNNKRDSFLGKKYFF